MEGEIIEKVVSDEEKIINFLSSMETYNKGIYDFFTDNIDEIEQIQNLNFSIIDEND